MLYIDCNLFKIRFLVPFPWISTIGTIKGNGSKDLTIIRLILIVISFHHGRMLLSHSNTLHDPTLTVYTISFPLILLVYEKTI